MKRSKRFKRLTMQLDMPIFKRKRHRKCRGRLRRMLGVLLGVLQKKAESVVDLVLGAGLRPGVALLFYKKEKKGKKTCVCVWGV